MAAPPPRRLGSTLAWLLALAVFWAYMLSSYDGGRDRIPYSEFKDKVRAGEVAGVRFSGDRVEGTLDDGGTFKTALPSAEDRGLLELLESKGVEVRAEPGGTPWLGLVLIQWLPWILLIGFFIYSNRAMREQMGARGGPFGMLRSRAKRFQRSLRSETFQDVAGVTHAKRDLEEIVGFLKNPAKYRRLGVKLPKGILFMGAPGTGKTLLARALAGEADVPFFSISGSEFIEMFVGVGASRVRDMFATAKREAPSIIFIDEIDSIGRARGTGLGGGHDEREQTLNQILSEMDGFSPQEPVVVIAATNRPDVLDPALTRPGRFDRRVVLDPPDRAAREQTLRLHARAVPLADDVDLGKVAAATPGFSGADLSNLVNEAALLAARKDRDAVVMEDFEEARDRLTLGTEREALITEDEKRLIACHEAGHALAARLTPGADPVQKVTIIPRGHALGATQQLPAEDKHTHSEDELRARIAVLLGGRVSEELLLGKHTTGSQDDLDKATTLARRMVCRWGMSGLIGPVSLPQGEEHVFLGREIAQPKDFSEHTSRVIDEEVRRILGEVETQVRGALGNNRVMLSRLAQALAEKEVLQAEEIDSVVSDGQPQPAASLALGYQG